MPKIDLIKLFIDEIYSNPPRKNDLTKKKFDNHVDEKWSIDLAGFPGYKTTNNKGVDLSSL